MYPFKWELEKSMLEQNFENNVHGLCTYKYYESRELGVNKVC